MRCIRAARSSSGNGRSRKRRRPSRQAVRRYSHWPPSGIDFACVSPLQVRSQIAPPEQLTEHEPVHVMWHVEPPAQVTLPLLPTVTVHVDWLLQSRLHDSPQVPLHSVWSAHLSEQLSFSQALPPRSHDVPALHTQLDPVQSGGAPALLPPQWAAAQRKNRAVARWKNRVIIMVARCPGAAVTAHEAAPAPCRCVASSPSRRPAGPVSA